MPQSNDAELTELYTASTGVEVEDNEPNTGPPAGPPANNFDVRLQAVAGNAIGNSGADYTLRLDCIDESLSLRNASMSRGPPQPAVQRGQRLGRHRRQLRQGA